MPPEIKSLLGQLNLDDPLESLGNGFHRDSRNIEFDGTPPHRRVKQKPGNISITNSLLPVDGVNKTICEKYDSITQRIFFLNYNSQGYHGIYLYNTNAGTFQRLVEVGVNTIGDPLAFTAESHTNIDIIYGDSSQGNILYYIDSLGRASKINIDRALSGGYGNIQRSFLDVAKEPAAIPPYVKYESDPLNTINNLRKKLFRFKVRWPFDDNDKSVTSTQSEMPLPIAAFDQVTDADATSNCRIAITYLTGPPNVKKIELLASASLGNVMSDFFLIASIDKAVEGIGNNDVATFLFYNNQAYNYIDVTESIQLFDYVPKTTLAQTLLNGNVLSYGNINEGYPNLTDFTYGSNTSNISPGESPFYYGYAWSNLIANQDGESAFGVGNIHIVIRGIVISAFLPLDTYTVFMTDGTDISYTLSTGDDAAGVIEGLRVDAISKGYTIISSGDNDLIVFKNGISLARAWISSDYIGNSIINTSTPAYDWSSRHGWALVYFDEKERTNGAVYTTGFSVNSSPYTEGTLPSDKPLFNASIYHVPPDWAFGYQWLRSKDLTKSKIQQWITDRTYKDSSNITGQVKYAYLSIESLNVFVKANPGSPLGYGFTTGDRVKMFKRYNADNTTAYLYYNTKDFEIIASVTSPTINGAVRDGQFIKIVLPNTDGSFDFGAGFENYFIEMYTPAQSVANGLDVYYEYGERYAIGNPTLSNRFHQGMLQNQASDYSLPATFEFSKGDYYVRLRSVQTGNEFLYNIYAATITGAQVILMGINFVSQTYSDANITTQSIAYVGQPVFDPFTDSRWFIRAIAVTTFRVQGSVILNFPSAQAGSTWSVYLQNRYGEKTYIAQTFDASNAGVYTFNVDFYITLEDDRLFLLALGSSTRTVEFLTTNLTFTIDHVIPQRMIDQNFSDYFPSIVNSNGRSFVYDSNANSVTYPDMYRWGLAYQKNTNINNANRFYPENFDETNRMHGAIMKMAQQGNELIFFLERKIGHTGVYQKAISDTGGNTSLITTNSIITSNNIQYYDGDFGVGNQATSVVQSGFVFYYVDPIKCKILRLSRDGNTDLTELYKVQTWASENIYQYLNPGNYPFGGVQKILGVFNIRPDNVGEYLLLRQGAAVAGEIMAFEEKYNSFYGKIDTDCDALVCAENVLYAFRNGVLWKQSAAAYNNFFGVQKTASITLVFNDSEPVKKVFNALAYQSNRTWTAPTKGDVKTNSINSQTFLQQESLIMEEDFDVLENPNRYAAFNRDQNSMSDATLALWEGDYVSGNYIIVRLSIIYNGFSYLYSPYITWKSDPRNF